MSLVRNWPILAFIFTGSKSTGQPERGEVAIARYYSNPTIRLHQMSWRLAFAIICGGMEGYEDVGLFSTAMISCSSDAHVGPASDSTVFCYRGRVISL